MRVGGAMTGAVVALDLQRRTPSSWGLTLGRGCRHADYRSRWGAAGMLIQHARQGAAGMLTHRAGLQRGSEVSQGCGSHGTTREPLVRSVCCVGGSLCCEKVPTSRMPAVAPRGQPGKRGR